MKLQTPFLNLLLASLGHGSALPNVEAPPQHEELTQRSSPSNSSTLEWGPCKLNTTFVGDKAAFDCSKLRVPWDYTRLDSESYAKLDLLRIRGANKPFKGSILFNPGGPGDSGIDSVAALGHTLQNITGGHYDIITFDTRGTPRTVPFYCNMKDPASLTRRAPDPIPQTDNWEEFRDTVWKQGGELADACYDTGYDNGRYIGTAFAARDMLSIVDALGQGPKLNYWGTSYGTVLGQVFASMFPDRVGRVMLDANMLADNYLTGSWIGSTNDAEKALLHILSGCADAGPSECPLAGFGGKNNTGEDLFNAFSEALKGEVGEVLPEDGETGENVVFALKAGIKEYLYHPKDYGVIVKMVEASLNGNFTEAVGLAGFTSGASLSPSSSSEMTNLALLGTSCSDSSFRAADADDLHSLYRAQLSESVFGDVTMAQQLYCARWKFSAAEQVDTNKLRNIKTSTPVLVVSGKYDPVTPLGQGWEVSSRLRKSRLVVHGGAGHSLLNHPSNCTNEAVRKYFTDGEMPKIGTACEPDLPLFEYMASLANQTSKD